MGRRLSIPIVLSQETGEMVEIYSELIIPPTPKDPQLGYEDEDMTVEQGVVLTWYAEPVEEKSGEDDETKPTYLGETMSLEDFMDRYIKNSGTRIMLERTMEELGSHTMSDDKLLDNLNMSWFGRELGSDKLGYTHGVC